MSKPPLRKEIIALIHHVQLNESGWWQKAVGRMVTASLWVHGAPTKDDELPELVGQCTGISVEQNHLAQAISELSAAGDIFRLPDGSLKLSEQSALAVGQQVSTVERIERQAAAYFHSLLEKDPFSEDIDSIWLRTPST